MPKALFFNVPAHGHVNPSLPLVAELGQRSHEIIYFTTEHFRLPIEATGALVAIYEGVADNYFDAHGLDGSVPQLVARELLKTAKVILPDLLQRVSREQPDYILYDSMCPWGYFVAEVMHLPSVSSTVLMPLTPRLMRKWQVFGLFLPGMMKGFRAGIEANRLSQNLSKQYDARSLGMMEFVNAPADLVISYSSAAYVPFAHLLPDNFKLVGWTLQENTSDDRFVHESSHPLIYVSLGTVANANLTFFQTCVTALADMPYDVLITTGGRFAPEQFGKLPDNITIKSWVPQSLVIQQAALFITHGGLNSIHDGLYYGLPLLVVPQQVEQTLNGMRVIELGAGLMLRRNKLTVPALRESVTKLLSDDQYRSQAKRIGESLQSAGGVTYAADEIEHLLQVKSRI